MSIYNSSLFIYISSWDSLSSGIAKPEGLYIFNFKNTQTFLEKGCSALMYNFLAIPASNRCDSYVNFCQSNGYKTVVLNQE